MQEALYDALLSAVMRMLMRLNLDVVAVDPDSGGALATSSESKV